MLVSGKSLSLQTNAGVAYADIQVDLNGGSPTQFFPISDDEVMFVLGLTTTIPRFIADPVSLSLGYKLRTTVVGYSFHTESFSLYEGNPTFNSVQIALSVGL